MNISEIFSGNPLGDSPQSREFRSRIPLLWIFLPQLIAYVLCESGLSFSKNVIPYALSFSIFLAAISLFFAVKNYRSRDHIFEFIWKCTFPISAIIAFGVFWSSAAPPTFDPFINPPSDVVAEIKIEKTFSSSGKSWSGIARLESVSGIYEVPKNARIYYRFPKENFAGTPTKGMKILFSGIATPTQETFGVHENFKKFLLSQNALLSLTRGRDVKILNENFLFDFSSFCFSEKQKILNHFVVHGSKNERESRAISAMILGESPLLFSDQSSTFLKSGVAHIFAISGVHISI